MCSTIGLYNDMFARMKSDRRRVSLSGLQQNKTSFLAKEWESRRKKEKLRLGHWPKPDSSKTESEVWPWGRGATCPNPPAGFLSSSLPVLAHQGFRALR